MGLKQEEIIMTKEERYEELRKEDALIYFDGKEEDQFLSFLDHLKLIDVWKEVELPDVFLRPAAAVEGSTGLEIRLGGTYYPLINAALYSVKRRADNCGKILNDMSAEDVAYILNKSWPYLRTKGKENRIARGLIRGDNVISLHSGRYVPFSQKKVFSAFGFYLHKEFDEVKFHSAVYQHHLTEATYIISSSRILPAYVDALNCAGYIITADEISVAAVLRTSDTAKSSISILPVISIKKKPMVPFSVPLKIVHKDKTTMDVVKETFKKIFSLVESATEHLQQMLQIELNYPESVAIRVAKKFSLPKLSVMPLQPDFKWYENNHKTMTAHDFYMTMCDIMNCPKYDALTEDRKLKVKDSLSKILYLSENDWQMLDRPVADW